MAMLVPESDRLEKRLDAPAARSAATMWNQPYLETCCRSALHRLCLCDGVGRPPGLKDGKCLERLADMGLARRREDGRFVVTAGGEARHDTEIMKVRPSAA